MSEICASVDGKIGLTTFTVSGKVMPGELNSYADAYRENQSLKMVLWDIRDGDMSSLDARALREGVQRARGRNKAGEKKAFVFSRDVDFGIGRMMSAYCGIEGYQSSIKIFRDVNNAIAWLTESIAQDS